MAPRLLLLTSVAPGRVNAGRIYVRDLCLLYPADRLCCVHLHPLPDEARSPELDGVPMAFIPAPPESGYQKLGAVVGRLTRPLIETIIELVVIPRLIRRIVEYGRKHHVEMLFAILHAPTSMRVAKRAADALGVPLVTLVWDPPAPKLAEHSMVGATKSKVLATFDRTLRAAVRCGVMSEAMKQRYEHDHGTDCIVMRYGLRRPPQLEAAAPGRRAGSSGSIVIGFAGAMYAPAEWNAFIEALARRRWRIAGRDVVIRVFGSQIRLRATVPVRIEYLGWRDTDEMLTLLSAMDVAYLPYWFDDAYREEVQQAFPSKLSTYVTARLPVFFHGPRASSPAAFLEKYPVGVACHTLDRDEIAHTLETFVADGWAYERARRACDEAFDHELSAPVFRRRFAALIGIPEQALRPADQCRAG